MKKHTYLLLFLIAFVVAGLAGCDDAPPPPPPVQPPPSPSDTQPALPERPSTQAIEAPPKRISLGVIPFSAEVPPVWEVKSPFEQSNVRALMGPTPRFTVEIQLSQRARMKAATVDLMVNAAAGDKNAKDPYYLAKEFKIGDVRVLERRNSDQRSDSPLRDASGKTVSARPTYLKWKVLMFVPLRDEYEQYEVSFSELTVEQYEADKALLNRVVESLSYDAAGAASLPSGVSNTAPDTIPHH